jgi:hypothetical protein
MELSAISGLIEGAFGLIARVIGAVGVGKLGRLVNVLELVFGRDLDGDGDVGQ